MDRAAWQQLSNLRVEDAEALLNAGRWSAAYYLAGYAVECGLKSCVLAFLERTPEVIFLEGGKRFSERCWTHDLKVLVELAGLKAVLESDGKANPALGASWSAVQNWSEEDRYRHKIETGARELFEAVTDPIHGVLPWIKAHW